MAKEWRQAYNNLTHFVAEHHDIEIGASQITIPEGVRPEFYRLFNIVRTSFIENNFSNLCNRAAVMSKSYTKVEQEITELLRLEDVSFEDSLRKFLTDPMDELKTRIFHPLFELLQVKVDIEAFENNTLQSIKNSFGPLYQSGYKLWVSFSIVNLLEAAKLYQVALPKLQKTCGKDLREIISRPIFQVPPPIESRQLSFKQVMRRLPWPVNFIVPDLIVYSDKYKRYFSLNLQMGNTISDASELSENRVWYPKKSISNFKPGFILAYTADNPEEIALVADRQKICRPDLIIECQAQEGWYQSGELDEIKLHHDTLKPIRGTYIVTEEAISEKVRQDIEFISPPANEQGSKEQDAGIHLITTGFDQLNLEAIIEALMMNEVAT